MNWKHRSGSDWGRLGMKCELGNICSRLSSGKNISAKLIYPEGKYPVYGGNGLRGYTNDYNFEGECAIIGRQGAFCGNVRYFKGTAYMTEHAIVACANENNSTLYLSYLLSTLQLGRLSGQSAQPGLSVKTLAKQIIDIPTLKIQNYVSSILRSLDDKIELNNKINENLEQQAKSLYTKIFLNNSESEITLGTLSDIATITMGQSPNGNSYNEDANGTVFYQGRAEFGFRFPTRRLFTTEPKRMAEAGDVLLSIRAPVGDLNVAYEKCCIGRGLGAIHSKNGNSSFVLYTMFALRPQLDVFNGEGTVFGSINRDALNAMLIKIPSEEKIAQFEAAVRPMDEIIRKNYEENCCLEDLRNFMLPKLMSGEIDVSNILL